MSNELPPSDSLPYDVEPKTEIFYDSTVYFSASIKGIVPDPLIGFELVTYMLENGAAVPSCHVGGRNDEERRKIFTQMSGRTFEGLSAKEISDMFYQQDMEWVDSASHLVAVVDGASHGVGFEIARALFKPARGLNLTPVLCLVSADNFESLSSIIKGATTEFESMIKVVIYNSVEEAKGYVKDFLSSKIT